MVVLFRKTLAAVSNYVSYDDSNVISKLFIHNKNFKTIKTILDSFGQAGNKSKKLGIYRNAYEVYSSAFNINHDGKKIVKEIVQFCNYSQYKFSLDNESLWIFPKSSRLLYTMDLLTKTYQPLGIVFRNLSNYKLYFIDISMLSDGVIYSAGHRNFVLRALLHLIFPKQDEDLNVISIVENKVPEITKFDHWFLTPQLAEQLQRDMERKYQYTGELNLLGFNYSGYFTPDDHHSLDFRAQFLLLNNSIEGKHIWEKGCGGSAVRLIDSLRCGAASVQGTEISYSDMMLAHANIQYVQDTEQIKFIPSDKVKLHYQYENLADDSIDTFLWNTPCLTNNILPYKEALTHRARQMPMSSFKNYFQDYIKLLNKPNKQFLCRFYIDEPEQNSNQIKVPWFIMNQYFGAVSENWPDAINWAIVNKDSASIIFNRDLLTWGCGNRSQFNNDIRFMFSLADAYYNYLPKAVNFLEGYKSQIKYQSVVSSDLNYNSSIFLISKK